MESGRERERAASIEMVAGQELNSGVARDG